MRQLIKAVRHKYNAKPTQCDNLKFDSKKEARYYLTLKQRQQAGEVIFYLRQVPIDLPGNIKYRVDFVEFHADNTVRFVDVKGYATQTYKIKKKQVEALYPITIEEY